jgi:hypothetical protein
VAFTVSLVHGYTISRYVSPLRHLLPFTNQVLLPLVSSSEKPKRLHLSLPSPTPPKVWISEAEVERWSDACYCTAVLRQGKQLCLVVEPLSDDEMTMRKDAVTVAKTTHYLFLHMVRAVRNDNSVFTRPLRAY